MRRPGAHHGEQPSAAVMAYAAAGMYGAVAVDGLLDLLIPHSHGLAAWPVLMLCGVALASALVGPRLPRRVLALNGPLGVALSAYASATTSAALSDPAFLFALPVIWMGLFFSRRGALLAYGLAAVGELVAALVSGQSGPLEHWLGVMISVAAVASVVVALQSRNERLLGILARDATVDPLTAMLNRRGFDQRSATELARVRRDGDAYALVAFDVDHFKALNDRHGHDVGDRLLTHIAGLLRAQAREVDVLARFGGEEFVALLPGTDGEGAAAFAQRVRRALADDPGDLPAVTMSAGVRAGDPSHSITELLADADAALYVAKRSGRDRVHVDAGPGVLVGER